MGAVKRSQLEKRLEDRYILFGEWLYARHSVHYRRLPHYFFEFDIYDKRRARFLTLSDRLLLLEGLGVPTVPVLHQGTLRRSDVEKLIGPSAFDACFDNPTTRRADHLMEGLYLRTESNGCVSGRAKFVRPEFVERFAKVEHWQHRRDRTQRVGGGRDLWS